MAAARDLEGYTTRRGAAAGHIGDCDAVGPGTRRSDAPCSLRA